MATPDECATWRQQLEEKGSYVETWRQNQKEAEEEYGDAISAKLKADSDLTAAQEALERAQNLVRHWSGKKKEADDTFGALQEAYKNLKWKIDRECDGE